MPLHIPRINYQHLMYFWAVVRTGSLRQACEELNLSAPTVSAQLRTFEERIGEKLLMKSGRTLVPTEIGTAFRTNLGERLPTYEVDRLLRLPSLGDRSYICVWEPGQPVAVHPVANEARPRIRLREILAALDPRLDTTEWDWETHPGTALIRATIDDLTPEQCDATGRHCNPDDPTTDPADAVADAGV